MKKFLACLTVLVMMCSFASALADEAFIIGCIGPTTKDYAQYGLAVENAAKLAAEEINALGGIQFTSSVKTTKPTAKRPCMLTMT